MNNKSKFLVRKFKVYDLDSIKRIIKNLHPEWFTEEALEKKMRNTTVILGIMILILSLSCTKTETADLAITNVTVIDVTGAPAQSAMTVLITDNRISKIAKTKKTKVADGVQIIDGSGKFLIPGLWEMYAHLGWKKDSWDLFIANGVTNLRVNLGFPDFHEWRKEISAGELIGPRMIIGSRSADGRKPGRRASPANINNEAEGRQFVRNEKKVGADFIKLGTYLSRDAYFAIVDEAEKQGVNEPVLCIESNLSHTSASIFSLR